MNPSHLKRKKCDSHCAIQFYDGIAGRTKHFRYKLADFENCMSMTSKIELILFKMNRKTKKYEIIIKSFGKHASLEIIDNKEFS